MALSTRRFAQPWGTILVASRRPHPALRDTVVEYRAFTIHPARALAWLETPMALPAIYLSIGEPGRRFDPPGCPTAVYAAQTSALRFVPPGPWQGAQVMLTLDGANRLLGPRLWEFADTLPDAGDILGRRLADVPERLAQAPGWDARFALLDEVFLGLGPAYAGRVPAPLAWAWERLLHDGDVTRIGDLARETGWSRRRLQQAFQRHVGVAPRDVASLTRFRRTLETLVRAPAGLPHAALAARCGYYDQSHLIREFKAVTGLTPGALCAAPVLVHPTVLGAVYRHASVVVGEPAGAAAAGTRIPDVPGARAAAPPSVPMLG
ncbi:helix-turn-helix domain-containing protein [Streptomyces huiliensis]|uniref:helix-turn-helix domain-containing protein n=1 Tax=Streptomyces huiliensis TaxID=2876027 RepID=UPI001CC125FD|nr:helix-turn-helix domain-containing protein [Streptomyces huiliensis]MBZ4322256.1 helix-turn-helix domain-containing protein [Streptomyces huiliensis]